MTTFQLTGWSADHTFVPLDIRCALDLARQVLSRPKDD